MRARLRWAARQPRTWVALAAAAAATALTRQDDRPGWTLLVAVATLALAALSVASHHREAHQRERPPPEDRERARVEEILWRYERQREARRRAAEEAAGEGAGDAGERGR